MDAPGFARTRPRRRHGALGLTREPVCDVLLLGLFLRGDSNVSMVQAAKHGDRDQLGRPCGRGTSYEIAMVV